VTAPADIKFSFGVDFQTASDRLKGEADERRGYVKRGMPYHVSFLDDLLGGILPHDLILLGAATGAGKTELARQIATENARKGKHVYFFALEAEPKEIERRMKHSLIAELMHGANDPALENFTYREWYWGKRDDRIGDYSLQAEDIIRGSFSTLHTYYRGSKFGHEDIKRLFLAIQDQADLIVLDHLHYVDIDDENENRGFKDTVKMIRDVALGIGKPVVLVAHLRKRDTRSKSLVPDAEMFHGSSDIIKVCTNIVLLAPAHAVPSQKWYAANTFMYVPKDRMGGASGYVAVCFFDRRMKRYGRQYMLGRLSPGGDAWEPLGIGDQPHWATNHVRPT
jgi:hypothetical protein